MLEQVSAARLPLAPHVRLELANRKNLPDFTILPLAYPALATFITRSLGDPLRKRSAIVIMKNLNGLHPMSRFGRSDR